MISVEYTNELVTGGAGFLGSQLVRRLLPISRHVVVIDDLSTGTRSAVPEADNLTFHEGSITNQAIYGDGTQTRDYTYVEDVMDALILAGQHPGMLGDVFNVGSGKEASVLELATTILEVAGETEHPIQFRPTRVIDTVDRSAVNPEKLTIETSWKAKHTLANGLEKTLQWTRGVAKP